MRKFLFVRALACVLSAVAADDAVLDTIAQINHINWVVNTIKTYNNAIVLEEEYEKISPGRLNLNRIPDEETLGRITKMLDTLHSLRKEERGLQYWRDHFEANRKRRVRQFWANKVSDGVDGLLAQATKCVSAGGNPAAIAQMVVSDSCAVLNTYSDYDKFVGEIEREADDKLFSFDTEKLDMLHVQNKDLLEDQWRLIKKNNLDDSLRVSDTDIKLLISCLKDDDHARVYSRIEPMQEKFKLFPTYWYYLSCAALETGHYAEGLIACDVFFKVNRGLFRDDPMVGGVAINKAFMMEKTEANKFEVRRCLDLAWKNNAGTGDWRRDYLAAALYKGVFGDQAMAEKVMIHAIALIEASIHDRLHSRTGAGLDATAGENLWECKRFLEQLRNEKFEMDDKRLKQLCAGEMTSSIEKLYYLGRMRSQGFWQVMKDDVLKVGLNISTKVEVKGLKKRVSAEIPVKWFLSGGFAVRLNLYSARNKIASVEESIQSRETCAGKMVVSYFDVSSDDLDRADSFRLLFDHNEYPVAFTFSSHSAYRDGVKAKAAGLFRVGGGVMDGKFSTGKLQDDLFLCDVSFCGKVYRWDPKSGVTDRRYSPEITTANWREWYSGVFPNLTMFDPEKPVDRGLVSSIVYDAENNSIKIGYENKTEQAIKPNVSIYFLNLYGSVINRYDDAWKFKKLKPGEKTERTVDAGKYGRPVFVDVESN